MIKKTIIILCSLIMLEILLRFFVAEVGPSNFMLLNQAKVESGIVSGPHPPNWTHTYNDLVAYRVHYNNYGFRNDENISQSRPNDENRILMLGDSFTYSLFSQQSSTYPVYFEHFLRAKNPNKNIKVLNAGVAGWSFVSEYEFFVKSGVYFEPTHVVLNFHANDIDEMDWEKVENASSEQAEYHRLIHKTLSGSAAYMTIYEWLFRKQVQKGLEHRQDQMAQPKKMSLNEAKTEFLRVFNLLNDLIKAKNMKFTVVITPYCYPQNAGDPCHIVFEEANRLNIPVIDANPAFQGVPRLLTSHEPNDYHLTSYGNRILGESVAEKFVIE